MNIIFAELKFTTQVEKTKNFVNNLFFTKYYFER